MTTVEYDLSYLREALSNFEDYLLSKANRWPLGAHQPNGQPLYPDLTIETFLLARQRLLRQELPSIEAAEFETMETAFQNLLKRRRAILGHKASQGFHHRLNLWQQFIQDLEQDQKANRDRYSYEVRLRVMLALLHPYADIPPAEDFDRLTLLDQTLRSFFRSGAFIWPLELEKSFPPPFFWYLYGSLVPTKQNHP